MLSRTQVRARAVTALTTVKGPGKLQTVRDGALRIGGELAPLAFVISTGTDETGLPDTLSVISETFDADVRRETLDVYVYVASALGQEAVNEATLDTILTEVRAALAAAGFQLLASRIVPAQGGTALHQVGDRYFRIERQPILFDQDEE